MIRINKNEEGITMLEVLLTVFVLSIGILSSLMYFTASMNAGELAKDITVATTHGESILEEMSSRPTLANITSTNWEIWTTTAGVTPLPSESIAVVYQNPASDPLAIDVTVSWTRRSRQSSVSLSTELTK